MAAAAAAAAAATADLHPNVQNKLFRTIKLCGRVTGDQGRLRSPLRRPGRFRSGTGSGLDGFLLLDVAVDDLVEQLVYLVRVVVERVLHTEVGREHAEHAHDVLAQRSQLLCVVAVLVAGAIAGEVHGLLHGQLGGLLVVQDPGRRDLLLDLFHVATLREAVLHGERRGDRVTVEVVLGRTDVVQLVAVAVAVVELVEAVAGRCAVYLPKD